MGEDHSFLSSPATLAYMAATESTKAKARSTSSPKIRTGGNVDMNSDNYSPCKKSYPLHLLLTVKCLVMVGWASSVLTNSKDHQALRDFQCL